LKRGRQQIFTILERYHLYQVGMYSEVFAY